ncbi:MAG: AAA family ATPase [Syntrophobacterales bacterium]|nr:AAA family ATPase [Syntrophobacterales bacterium]
MQKYPFENTPDPEFFFFSPEHEEALSRLTYGVRRNKGALLLTGAIGCGKTLLSRVFIKQMQHENIDIGLIANPSPEPLGFLSETLYQFGLNSQAATKTEMLKILNNKLMENSNKSAISLLIIDEAQTIYKETFDEIRMLLNFQMNDRYLLNLLFLGQPELREMIVGNKQLDQRIAIRYHLNPLSRSDTTRYILFRLDKAGLKKNIFSDEALETIYAYSGGVPRKINNICDLSLLIGFSLKVELIDQRIVSGIIKDSL